MEPLRRALLSVSDKTGLVELARALAARSVELLASGGTARALEQAGLDVIRVSDYTGAPEILGGRVKTLHPKIHGGILARRERSEDAAELAERAIGLIDLVVVNLYPFEDASAGDLGDAELTEQVDIGGPTLLRAAAKSWSSVAVLCDPGDYADAIAALEREGGFDEALRKRLALKAFERTAAYDAAIAAEWRRRWTESDEDAAWPAHFTLGGRRLRELRYGENPHQRAALYAEPGAPWGLAGAELLGGKALSYNNLVDAEAAWSFVEEWPEPAACIVKHASPCGACAQDDAAAAIEGAFRGDPLSAFGGILAFNRELDLAAAKAVCAKGRFIEVVIAAGFSAEALARLKKKKAMRILKVSAAAPGPRVTVRPIAGGFLVQDADDAGPETLTVVGAHKPEAARMLELPFALHCVKHVRSNAIVFVKDNEMLGAGGGQPSRVDAVKQAAAKAGERARGAILASDAFFPFPDGVEAGAEAGAVVVVQPGGSKRDDEVTAAADKLGLAMIHSHRRHFKH